MEITQDIRLAAVDLDGTLMDSANHIGEAAIRRIGLLNEAGCLVVPCTGRYLGSIPVSYTHLFIPMEAMRGISSMTWKCVSSAISMTARGKAL